MEEMKQKPNHSATPWRFEPETEDDLYGAIVGTNRDEPPVMILDSAELENDDLDFMLRAVNSFDELVDALKTVERAFLDNDTTEDKHAPWIPGGSARPVLETVRAAIARAERVEGEGS